MPPNRPGSDGASLEVFLRRKPRGHEICEDEAGGRSPAAARWIMGYRVTVEQNILELFENVLQQAIHNFLQCDEDAQSVVAESNAVIHDLSLETRMNERELHARLTMIRDARKKLDASVHELEKAREAYAAATVRWRQAMEREGLFVLLMIQDAGRKEPGAERDTEHD